MFKSLWSVSCLQSMRKVGKDPTVLLICITVFLSYLPEAGQYSSFFLYLRQVNIQLVPSVGLYPDFHFLIPFFSHTRIYSITGLVQKGAPKKPQKNPLGVYYKNANRISTSNSEFLWRLLPKYANGRKQIFLFFKDRHSSS